MAVLKLEQALLTFSLLQQTKVDTQVADSDSSDLATNLSLKTAEGAYGFYVLQDSSSLKLLSSLNHINTLYKSTPD